jgi:hypothetical protein
MSLPRDCPIYIVSKGRHQSRLTAKALERMRVPYFIIVERQEYNDYASVIDPKKILILDPKYQDEYDAFWQLPPGSSKGSGPARNFGGDHSRSLGAKWHWIIDDNIRGFYRLNNNLKIQVLDETFFRVMEDFVFRYKNVAMAGPNYHTFADQRTAAPPFYLNTRIYSCNLIRNDLPFRWRGRYNEDTDLSLRMLKAGWCTVLFNAFLAKKVETLAMKGGNTDTIYKGGTLQKSQMLYEMHPDVTKVVMRWDRPHHHVDYTPFKRNKLIRRSDVRLEGKVNNYGMELVQIP